MRVARVAVLLLGLAQCWAGVQSMGSKVELQELERLVRESGNEELVGEVEDVKILHEKSVSLREGFFVAEADALDKRIHVKLEKIHAEATRERYTDGSEEEGDDEEDRNEIERRQRMKEYAKRHKMRSADFDPSDFGSDYDKTKMRHKYRHEHFMHDAMRHDGRHDDGRDIHERHKDLLTHREQDFKKRLDKAGFSPDEESVMIDKFEEYLAIEREVMNSRMSDRSKEARAAHRKKSKADRDIARDEMKVRRQQEKDNMHQAREMRKEIDNLIREKTMNNNFASPELR